MDLRAKKLGLMLSTGPEHPVNLRTTLGLADAALDRGASVYLYLIDDGVRALRQPGSALKPFAYGLALSRGDTPASLLSDVELRLATPTGDWVPRNYDRRVHGPVRLRAAQARGHAWRAGSAAGRTRSASISAFASATAAACCHAA